MLFLFIEKHQAEFQLDYIQLSPEIIGESVRHVPFQKKKEKKSRKKNRLRNESLYRHQREFHSFPVDKFSSTWFISYKNGNVCVCVCPGPDRFQPLLGSRYIHAGISWPSVAGFSCILFTHFIPREFPQFYISIGWSPASGASPLVPVYRATHPWDSYLISNSSPSFASFSREPQNRGTALPSMYRLVVLSFLSPAILYHPVITLSFVRTLHPRVDTFFITRRRDKVSPAWILSYSPPNIVTTVVLLSSDISILANLRNVGA